MNIKSYMVLAVAALTAACGEAPATEEIENAAVAEETVAAGTASDEGGPCGDGRELGENEVCP